MTMVGNSDADLLDEQAERIAELEAKNERLMAALKAIAQNGLPGETADHYMKESNMRQQLARESLEQK